MFFNKKKDTNEKNSYFIKVAALLIHAAKIDEKMDDGLGNQGSVFSGTAGGITGGATCDTAGVYQEALDQLKQLKVA